ncbi:MAG: hypothetical protein M9887_08060 [Chitinophagales bacterium]|nr:hypothetical protein [Chitinophagales bacterium]
MIKDIYNRFWRKTLFARKKISKQVSGIILYLAIFFFLVFIYDFGFDQSPGEEKYINLFYHLTKWILVICFGTRNFLNIFNRNKLLRVKILDLFILLSLFSLYIIHTETFFLYKYIHLLPSFKHTFIPLFSFIFIVEYSRNAVSFYTKRLNPFLILLLSFLIVIFIGGILLSLPNSTTRHISTIDIFFTSVSAVCVTGLGVIDVSKDLTLTGQIIVLMLIQIGGLGIMTFTSFIGFMFSGSEVSFQQRILQREMSIGKRINEVARIIYKVVLIMIIVEFIGAVGIYKVAPNNLFDNLFDKIFFSIFHSVAAFCNSGLSNYPGGLQNVNLRFEPFLLLNISFLIIIGGIGFPIILNFYDYLKKQIVNVWNLLVHKKRFQHVPYLINLNSRIILYTTGILLLIGFVFVFIFEYNNTLREFSFGEKLAVSFFTSATSRTAGFNAFNFGDVNFPTYILIVLLMWVGASPGGTGGGIKTTTFAIMVTNFISLAKGKERLLIDRREISVASINKSFAIVMSSILVIGLSVTLILSFDPGFSMEEIVFEAFSAFSTTGLTMGITPNLSAGSKVVLMILMLVGRVGVIATFSAFFFDFHSERIKYPKQQIELYEIN